MCSEQKNGRDYEVLSEMAGTMLLKRRIHDGSNEIHKYSIFYHINSICDM